MAEGKSVRRRVAVTGVGLVTPLGVGVEANWSALCTGRSGVGLISRFDPSAFSTKIAGEVRDFSPEDYIDRKELRKMDLFIQFALAATVMAMDSSGFQIEPEVAERTGVIVGVGLGGIQTIEESHRQYLLEGKKISPFFIPKLIANLAPGQIAIRYGARGINYTPTSACSSGGHAVGEAMRLIRDGYQDAMICGGAEAAISALGVGGFVSMRALSSRNDEPTRASRPFDKDRDGFVMGEGAGILVLEEWEAAQARGAGIRAEVIGYGTNGDAFHITQPAPEGVGAARCMKLCLEDAEIAAEEVGYINAHGTSTPVQRFERDSRHSHGVRFVCRSARGQLDEVYDRASARRCRGNRGRVHGARPRSRCPASDHQPGHARSPVRSRYRAEHCAQGPGRCGSVQFLWIRWDEREPRLSTRVVTGRPAGTQRLR